MDCHQRPQPRLALTPGGDVNQRMPSDNVTPFRRPKPVRPQQQGGLGIKTHRGRVVLVHVLTMASFAVPFVLGAIIGPQGAQLIGFGIAIAGVFVAYSSRNGATPWAATHHEQALRTILIASIALTILSLPRLVVSADLVSFWQTYGPIWFWGRIIVLVWAGLRALIGLVLAVLRRPVFNPRGWLI